MGKDDHTRDAVLQPLGTCPGGHRHGVLWEKDGTANVVTMEPAEAGSDPPEGVERLRFVGHREGTPFYDVQVTGRRGPAKVNSEAYKQAWERIFGNKTVEGEA